MLISTGKLTRDSRAKRDVVVTGAGGGIGYEAARSLLWLGARVVIAEVDQCKGNEAAQRLAAEFGSEAVLFVQGAGDFVTAGAHLGPDRIRVAANDPERALVR
jgi:NAD(P)-dependent dehydrogenase (short-subunit alcohol dehydrogenase family)